MIAPRPVLCCMSTFSPATLLVWWPDLLRCLSSAESAQGRGRVASAQGWLYALMDDWDLAIASYLQAIEAYQSLRDSGRIGELFYRVAAMFTVRQQWIAGRRCAEMAVHHLQRSGNLTRMVAALRHLSLIHLHQGRQRLALRTLERALAQCSQLGDGISEALVLGSLGQVYTAQGKLLYGLACYDAALDLLQRQPAEPEIFGHVAWLRCLLGELCYQCNHPELALEHYSQALSQRFYLSCNWIAHILHQIGQINEQLQRPTAALHYYQESFQACQIAGIAAHPVALEQQVSVSLMSSGF